MENNGTEKIGLVTPTPDLNVSMSPQHYNNRYGDNKNNAEKKLLFPSVMKCFINRLTRKMHVTKENLIEVPENND